MINKTFNKIEFKNNNKTIFIIPNDEYINKFLNNWYFYQNYLKTEKDISVFKINYVYL
jgi:predicted Zn-dependent protease